MIVMPLIMVSIISAILKLKDASIRWARSAR
jgi:L-cystine uptake protein TcyP (sodium:dicarboxylate symporter family)